MKKVESDIFNELNGKKLCILGTGGFGRETLLIFIELLKNSGKKYQDLAVFMENDAEFSQTEIMGVPVIRQSEYDHSKHLLLIAIGSPTSRKGVVNQFPADTVYATLIHPSVEMSSWVELGEGSIVAAGTIITCNIKIGRHAQLNLHSTIGHDCDIGDYFTSAPGAKISDNCEFGNCVYFGTSAVVRQGVRICDDVTIGMGGVVVKNVMDPGVFVGNPLKPLSK